MAPSLLPVCTRMVCVVVASFVLLEAAATITVTGNTTFDYGDFVSEYVRLESDVTMIWYDGVDACRAHGPDWDIAGIYSAGGNAAVRAIFPTTTGVVFQGHIGGYYPSPSADVASHLLLWYGGRFKGVPVSSGLSPATCLGTWCNYQAGEPNNGGGSATLREHALNIYADGTWNDLAPEGWPTYPANFASAVICEKSACSILVDCETTNTINVTGYAPSCTCTCKTGYRGGRCQVINTTVPINGINYGVWCDVSVVSNATVAQTRCVDKGSGWALASIPTAGVNTMLHGLTNYSMWTSGVYVEAVNKYVWQYGRYGGQYFSDGWGTSVTCVAGMFCDWNPGEPNRASFGGSAPETDVMIWGTEQLASRQWNDLADVDSISLGMRKTYNVNCYACERSPCLQTDCPAAHTHPRGYYPNCLCLTNSVTLSLSITSNVSTTESVSSTTTPSGTATLSLPITSSATTTISPSISTSPSGSLSATATTSLSVSTSLSRSSSSSIIGTPSNTVSLTTTHLTQSISTTPTSTISPSHSTTMSKSRSATGLTQTSTRTEERTESSTYAANTTLVAQMLAQFPLFTDVAVDDNTVRSGSTRSLTPNYNSTALWELLAEAGARRVRVTGIPIVAAVPALGPVGVTGNEGGFFRTQPNTTLLMPNSTTLDLTLAALPQYSITVGERLLLYTSMRELLNVDVLTDHRDVDELHLVGTIVVSKGDTGMSGPSIVTTVVTGGGGALGAMAPELQGVGALALMGCSDPNTKSSFGSYRVLSPVAVQDSYAGVIIGNVLLTGAVGVVQLGVVLVLRFCRRVQRTVEQMATARFPSFFIAAALAFHTGTAFASAQLISQPGNYAGWEMFVGVAGFVYSLVLPVAMAAHPYLRVSRAYQEYRMVEWLGARRWPAWIVWVVPRGALFSLETRQAYGLYLSAYRAPPRQLFWTSIPTWTPLVFLVAGLFHPNTVPGCRAQFACMGIAMVAIAALVVWRAPLRAHMAGWLDAASRLTLGCVMFCMGAAIVDGDKLNAKASNAAYAFIVVLMAITALRVLHHLLCMYTDYRMERDAVPLETVWTHVLGGNRKKTLQFRNVEDDSLLGIAGDRDAAGDADDAVEIEMPLVEDTSDDQKKMLMDLDEDDDEGASYNLSNASSLDSPTSRPQYSGINAFHGSDETDGDEEADITNNTPPLSSSLSLIEESSSSSSSSSLTPKDDDMLNNDDISIESL